MGTSVTVQMNIRIDSELKQSGDAALADMGFTPSQAVRGLWKRASQRGEDAAAVQALLADTLGPSSSADDPDPNVARRLAIAEQGWNLASALFHGQEPVPESASGAERRERDSDRESYLDALEERMRERGLL
ncbi:MAG: type II toxin-antitoxin system RelB/DinJ family antitoxin [Coriobacteriaceae bacterium]|nr:type II toxin-antitoxin system RelB/DinJ family antitoxin [Coriobacteriaceae bacterium]